MNERPLAEKQFYRVMINAPIDQVWSELINTSSPRPFFWDASWDTASMTPGNAYRMLSKDGKTVAVIGKILEMDPPHKLVHSFQLTNLPDDASTVTYTLVEKDGTTEFTLITENIVVGSKSEKSMEQGAKFIVQNFKAYIETGKVTFGARIMLAMYSLMAPLAPKSMSADKWPLDK